MCIDKACATFTGKPAYFITAGAVVLLGVAAYKVAKAKNLTLKIG